MELNELPAEVSHWYRKSETSAVYLSHDNNGMIAIVAPKHGKVEIGLYIPCAVQLKVDHFSNAEELIEILKRI